MSEPTLQQTDCRSTCGRRARLPSGAAARAEWRRQGYLEAAPIATDVELAKKWRLMQAAELRYRHDHNLL
jgi:hypothetical protein